MSTIPADAITCAHCKTLKARDEFYRRKGRAYPFDRMTTCRKCMAASQAAKYAADAQKFNRRSIAWQKQNPEKCAAARARRYRQDIEKSRAKGRREHLKRREQKRAYRAANRERIKARNAEYRLRKSAELKAYNAAYYRANADAVTARIRKSVAANPDLYQQLHKAAKHRRKVRLTNNGPAEKFNDREIFERDNWRCQLCGLPVDSALKHPEPMSGSLDHRLPIAKGGGHTRDNVQLAHLRCNLSKRDRTAA